MSIIKPLDWRIRKSDGVVYADPPGLRYAYYIKIEDNSFELAFIENDGKFDENESKTFAHLTLAQANAEEHYNKIVSNLLIKQ